MLYTCKTAVQLPYRNRAQLLFVNPGDTLKVTRKNVDGGHVCRVTITYGPAQYKFTDTITCFVTDAELSSNFSQ